MGTKRIIWKLMCGSTKTGQIGNDHTEAGGERRRHAPEDAAGPRTAVHQDYRHRSRVRRRINEREPYLTRRRTSLIDGSEGGNAHSLRHAGARMKATENGRNQEQCHVGTDQNPSPPLPELLRPHAGIFSKNSRTAGARFAAMCRFALLFKSETT